MIKKLKIMLFFVIVVLLLSYGVSFSSDIQMQETIYHNFTFPVDDSTYDYASLVDFYYGATPDSDHGGVHIGTNPHWPDTLFWSHTLPLGLLVPPDVISKAWLWIDAHSVNNPDDTVQIQGLINLTPMEHNTPDNTLFDLTGISEEGFWNNGSIQLAIWTSESLIRINEAILLLDYYEDHTDADQEEPLSPPAGFDLSQNYPNPFNPETEISFTLPERASVSLVLYNIFGQKVRELIDETLPAGSYKITWDGTDNLGNKLASGVYLCRLSAGKNASTSKMVLLK
jgi:hypothetical protein